MCTVVKFIDGAVRKNRLIQTMASKLLRDRTQSLQQCMAYACESEPEQTDIVLMMKMTAQKPPFSPRCCVLKFCFGARFGPKNGLSVIPNGDEFERIFEYRDLCRSVRE